MIRVVFLVLVIFIAMIIASYTTAVPEPAKLLALGAALVGVAFWGRRHLKRQGRS